jgi:hypothetical protein
MTSACSFRGLAECVERAGVTVDPIIQPFCYCHAIDPIDSLERCDRNSRFYKIDDGSDAAN